jgi:hypothetical protein
MMFKKIKQFLRPRFFQWGYGLGDTIETFWAWWLGMHPDHGIDDFWENIQCDPWVPQCGSSPWDEYLRARCYHKELFEFIEAAQGSNVWSQERIDRHIEGLQANRELS